MASDVLTLLLSAALLTAVTGTTDDATTTVTVSGTLDDATARVWVQGVPATISPGRFQATLPLPRGRHPLTARAEDPAGNVSLHAITVEVTDPALRRFSYDRNGNLTQQQEGSTTTSYTYDVDNRLTAVTALNPDPRTLNQFSYDGQGRRVSVTEGGVTTTSIYDGLLPVTERQGTTTTATHVWGLSYGGGIGGLLCRKFRGQDTAMLLDNAVFLYPVTRNPPTRSTA